MRKKFLIIMMIFFWGLGVVFSFQQPVNAWSIENVQNEFDRKNDPTVSASSTGMNDARETAKKLISNIIAIVQVVGTGIAIIMLSSLGIKYMTGSIEEKVQVKKHSTVYVVGALVFFSAAGILQILQVFIKENFK